MSDNQSNNDEIILETDQGQIVLPALVRESYNLIQSIGRTGLLSSKIFLLGLLKAEDKDLRVFSPKEQSYYDRLQEKTKVDYSKGLVAEIQVSLVKDLLNKGNSGSFYTSLRHLFEDNDSNLQNQWSLMIKDDNVYSFVSLISALSFDKSKSLLFIKFNGEQSIRDSILGLKQEVAYLPLKLMLSFKHIASYRLVQNLIGEKQRIDRENEKEMKAPQDSYTITYSLGQLQMLLGTIDPTLSRKAKRDLAVTNPPYNKIAKELNDFIPESQYVFKNFRRQSLDVAIKEINENELCDFTVSYETESVKGKITDIVFYLQNKNVAAPEHDLRDVQPVDQQMMLDLARGLSDKAYSYADLVKIASIGHNDVESITKAYDFYKTLNLKKDFISWFEQTMK